MQTADRGGYAPREEIFAVAQCAGLDEPTQLLLDEYEEAMPTFATPFPGVLNHLAQLRDVRWRLGVITNGGARI